jgi:hypothetical protein
MSLVTIASQDIADWHGLETPAYARLIANQEFVTSENVIVAPGSGFYQQFTCSVVSNKIRIASGSAYSTTDSDTPWGTYTLAVYSAKGSLLTTIAGNLRIPNTPSSTTWTALIEYSQARVQPYRFAFYDTNQTNVLLNNYALITGAAFSGNISVPDDAFSTNWDGSLIVATKNAIYNNSWTNVWKTADETRTNTATPTADSELKFTMEANKKYAFRFAVQANSDFGAGFRFGMTGPASPNVAQAGYSYAGTSSLTSVVYGAGSYPGTIAAFATGSSPGPAFVTIDGIIYNGSNAGDAAFSWAQQTSNGANTIVKAGSWLKWRRVA